MSPCRHLVRVRRKGPGRDYTDGFVLGLSDELVVMASVIDFQADGLEIFPVGRVTKVESSERDVFYVSIGGWDTHNEVNNALLRNYRLVDRALEAFTSEMRAQGVWDDVVVQSAAQLGVPTPTTARRLVDQDAPRIQRGSFAPMELPASGLGCTLCAAPATRAISAARRGRRPSAELKRATLAYV